MARKAKNLNKKQLQAIELLLCGMSYRKIADRLGVAFPTVSNWANHNVMFQRRLQEEKEKILDGISDRIIMIGDEALTFFYNALKDPELTYDQKLKAAHEVRSILQSSLGTQISHKIDKQDVTDIPLGDLELLFEAVRHDVEIPTFEEEERAKAKQIH